MFMSKDVSTAKMSNKIKYRYDSVFVSFLGYFFNKLRLVSNEINLTSRFLQQQREIDNTSAKNKIVNWIISLKLSYSVKVLVLGKYAAQRSFSQTF